MHFSFISKLLIAYILVCIFTFLIQRRMIYYPYKNTKNPTDYGLNNFKSITLTTEDNVTISAWQTEPLDTSKPVIVFFHGNAGNLSHRIWIFEALTNNGKYNLLGLDYRGYGNSTGSPSENGFYKDARTSIKHLLEAGFKESDIILYGESVGCAVAVQMATEYRNTKALILQSPFTSMSERAQEIYWYLPAKFLTLDKYRNDKKIPNIKTPTLFMHGTSDRIVPDRHSEELYKISTSPIKDRVLFEGKGHNDLNPAELAMATDKFLDGLGS